MIYDDSNGQGEHDEMAAGHNETQSPAAELASALAVYRDWEIGVEENRCGQWFCTAWKGDQELEATAGYEHPLDALVIMRTRILTADRGEEAG